MLYVTPEKYRTMGFGIDLAGIEDVELASVLGRASSLAEGYCAVPTGHSFFGGSVTAEQHNWTLPISRLEEPRRRIWPYHHPIKAVSSFRVWATNTQYVDVAPSELFINNADRYVEVVSLAFTNVGLFGTGIAGIGLVTPVAEIAYTYGWQFNVTGETLYDTDAATYRASNQFWLTTPAPAIYKNGVLQTTGYTVNSGEGVVVFSSPLAATDTVTADYSYTLPAEIKDAVGQIATYLLTAKLVASSAVAGLQSVKVGEVSITAPIHRVTAASVSEFIPQAAWLLDGFRYISVR